MSRFYYRYLLSSSVVSFLLSGASIAADTDICTYTAPNGGYNLSIQRDMLSQKNLIEYILESPSIYEHAEEVQSNGSASEAQFWFSSLPTMSESQRNELYLLLAQERKSEGMSVYPASYSSFDCPSSSSSTSDTYSNSSSSSGGSLGDFVEEHPFISLGIGALLVGSLLSSDDDSSSSSGSSSTTFVSANDVKNVAKDGVDSWKEKKDQESRDRVRRLYGY